LLLNRIVDGQVPQPLDLLIDGLDGGLIGRQGLFLAGDDVAALAPLHTGDQFG
jgi:hypothetical protein